MTSASDDELLEKVKDGNARAFEALVVRHSRAVYGLAFHLLGSQALAEEMSQETWMKVMKASENYESRGTARAWIVSICRNLCLDELRKKSWSSETGDEPADIADESNLSPDAWIQSEQEKAHLQKALAIIPERQRTVLVLLMTDMSLEEIARELSMNVNATKALLFRARESVRNVFAGGGS
jgi:RNA polymerase sigma-70 factor (ECF subfamily)